MVLHGIDLIRADSGVSRQTIYRLIRSGAIPAGVVVRFGPRLRVDPEAYSRWKAAGGTAGVVVEGRGRARR